MSKIVIFASGSGTNAENIIRYFSNSKNFTIVSLYCNSANAYVIERVKSYNIPVHIFDRNFMTNPDGLLKSLTAEGADIIVLAGFLWLMPDIITEKFAGRIVNIHPSLIPKFCGKGMYGMKVHEAVVAAGEKCSGITIHYVNGRYDEGDIIFQAECPVTPDDSAEDVAQKVHALEYEYYPAIIEKTFSSSI